MQKPVPTRPRRPLRDPGDDAGDVRAVEGQVAVERRRVRTGPREAARRDHLRRRRSRVALRKACRVREARRGEERMLVVDAVVDDGDLDSLAASARDSRERGGADHGGPTVQIEPVRVARVHALDGVGGEQVWEPLVREADGEAVDEHLVAAADGGLGDLGTDARDRLRLGSLQPAEVRARERAREVQLQRSRQAGKPARERRLGERRVVEGDDDSYTVVGARDGARVVGRGRTSASPGR